MQYLAPGDLVFSYRNKAIRATGHVTSSSVSSPQPAAYGDRWENDGWLVEVDFSVSETVYAPKPDWAEIQSLFPKTIKPLDKNGDGNQKVYLSKISDELGAYLLGKISAGLEQIPKEVQEYSESNYFAESEIWHDPKLEDTQRETIVLARNGQGKFRKRVSNFEKKCRVTDISDPKLLIASHIKPWRVATPRERLDGNNGLMLSPHVDHLFDTGLITFRPSGQILSSRDLPTDLFDKWGIDPVKNVGSFTSLQSEYLEFHNSYIFRK